jgi:hypothetical protein
MNNEPVAWMSNDSFEISNLNTGKFNIPLYIHPSEHDLGVAEAIGFDKGYKAATAKTLTDEEILDLCPPNHSDMMNEAYTIDFARAILKKAQE